MDKMTSYEAYKIKLEKKLSESEYKRLLIDNEILIPRTREAKLSKARRKIKEAVEAKGYTVEKMNYSGTDWRDGGWDIWLKDYPEVITGFNFNLVLENIDKYLPIKGVAKTRINSHSDGSFFESVSNEREIL